MAKAIGPKTKKGTFRSKPRKSKRKSSKRSSKPMMIKTTQTKLSLVSSEATSNGMFVELDKLLSQSNNKLYRQGMNYHARVECLVDGSTLSQQTEYQIYVLPKDHRTIGALRMARSIYNQAMKDELEIRPEVRSPWTDFKIETYGPGQSTSADDMFVNPARAYQNSYGADVVQSAVTLISDAYPVSEITSNAGEQRRFSLIDPTDTSHWNVFVEYTNFLLNRADPDSAVETPAYGDASPVLTEMAELSDKGDEPPYSWGWKLRDVLGDAVPHRMTLEYAGTISGGITTRQSLRSFIDVEAPLGLIFISANNDIDTAEPELNIMVKSGNYKGVKADRIYPKDKLLGF